MEHARVTHIVEHPLIVYKTMAGEGGRRVEQPSAIPMFAPTLQIDIDPP